MIPCRFFPQGRCMKGDTCQFFHDIPGGAVPSTSASRSIDKIGTAQTIPSQKSATKCYFFLNGKCRKGNFCPFDHSFSSSFSDVPPLEGTESVLATSHAGMPSTPCRYYLRGNCYKGEDCPYIHSDGNKAADNQDNGKEDDGHDDFTRELSGTLTNFKDGARVSKITLPSDFSAVHIEGLPPNTDPESVSALLLEFDYEVAPNSVRVRPPTKAEIFTLSADITMEDPSFAKGFCEKLKSSSETGGGVYLTLGATPISSSSLHLGSGSRRINCKKVYISWHKPSCLVWLNFGRGEIANRVSEKFNRGIYRILNQVVTADPAKHSSRPFLRGFTSGLSSVNPVSWTVVLKGVPYNATQNDITASIRVESDRPRHIELDRSNILSFEEDDLTATSTFIKSLLTSIGPVEFEMAPTQPQTKRYKAVARFEEEVDAREAVRLLHDKRQSFLSNQGTLTVQLVSSAKLKIATTIYDTLKEQLSRLEDDWKKHHLRFKIYRNTDPLQRFTTLKIEGEQAKDVAEATNTAVGILTGITLMDEGESMKKALWSTTLDSTSGTISGNLKQIEKDHGVVITRNKRKRHLKYFGPPRNLLEVQRLVTELVNDEASSSAVHIIQLELDDFLWACRGGFSQINKALGKEDGVALFDIVSTPKKIIVNGTSKQYKTALELIQMKNDGVKTKDDLSTSRDCTVCWTEAENPILTRCDHVYCSGCFEDLCMAAVSSGERESCISCQGEMGKCEAVFSLDELQDHLSSIAFEDVLETSFASYIRRHSQSYRYCPTPDCGYIYRPSSSSTSQSAGIITHTCTKCLELTCTACHSQHGTNMTCAQYKDLNSGGYEAFKRFKLENGIKDCPECETPMEKTEGCNHMTCRGCGTHICWVCLRTFRESGLCYEHMNAAHGGIGLNYLED